MNIYLEIFGYMGTALVILSMMMTSVLKLRIFNLCGSVLSLIYAMFCHTWPVALLNLVLTVINIVQILRQRHHKHTYGYAKVGAGDGVIAYFLSHYAKDIAKFFPDFQYSPVENTEVHVTFVEGEVVGVLIGEREKENLVIRLDYATARYRDLSVGKFVFPQLKQQGIKTLIACAGNREHNGYMKRLGFTQQGENFTKKL